MTILTSTQLPARFKFSTCALILSASVNVFAEQSNIDNMVPSGAGEKQKFEKESDRVQELEHIYITGNSIGNYSESANKAALKMILSQRETPQAVSVISNQMIQDLQAINIEDILRNATGFYTSRSSSLDRPNFMVRGGDVNLIQIDGVQQFPGGRRPSVNGDSVAFERVEIVRGANGLLTGAGEPTATVNLVRKRATITDLEAHIGLSAGSWNNRRAEIDIANAITEEGNVRARFVAAHYDTDSHVERYGQEKTSVYTTLEADLTDYTLLRVGAEYADTASRGAINTHSQPYFNSDGSRFNGKSSDTGMTAKWSGWPLKEHTYFIGIDHGFENDWQLSAITTYNTIEMQGGELFFIYPNSNINPDGSSDAGFDYSAVISSSEDKQHTFDITLQGPVELFSRTHEVIFSYNSFTRDRTSFGKEADQSVISLDGLNYHDWTGNVPRYPFKDLGREGLSVTKSHGGFVAARLNPHDQVKIILGARLTNWDYEADRYDAISGQHLGQYDKEEVNNEVTPYAGVIFDVSDEYSVYASYTEAFTPQTYFDANDKMLDPKTGESYEFGIKGELLDGALNFTAAIYENIENGLAVQDPNYDENYTTPGGHTPYIQRGKGDKTNGYEIELTGALSENWDLSASYSKHKTKSREGEELYTNEPKQLLNIFTTYDFNNYFQGFTAGFGVNWTGDFYKNIDRPTADGTIEDYRFEQSSTVLVNVMARYAINDKMSIALNVNNLFDKHYYDSVSNWSGNVLHGEPVNWKLAFRYSW
ncbi:outer-membrane receptor for ferric coprogen and ferric-rhodotorulic acid [Pseudoalteromonas citrea]|uniref:Outer-membrane receptor for ferric coprogen and ferric-rhodotorulic acid n=2 Tax=Pseudoalteromonas citrea TaxID=43655 RepID=A0AAD4AE92_9GAMM|nr:TonB-dependent siderophore receptor [Pseudoalteromonas citrea]KAF7764278.1 outer-membrane receptor for ferric coprogen and ferric-rhodotorulic acid [Pseudoalteromonas citrea]